MSASFWRFGNNYQSVPEITNILQKPDFTLEEVLDDPDIIQELISENGALIEYLSTSDVLQKLVTYIIEDDEILNNVVIDENKDNLLQNLVDTKDKLINNNDDNEINESIENNRLDNDLQTKTDYDNRSNDEDINNKIDEDNDIEIIKTETESKELDDDDNNDEKNEMKFDDEDEEEEEEEEEDEDDDEDEEETAEAAHHRRAQILAEILSQDNWTITHAFMKDNTHLLELLWTILDKPSPLSMSSSTYFMKINEHLLDLHLEDMIKFILSQDSLVERFMRHIDNPPLMDFLLKVISTDKGREMSTGVIDALQEKKLIPSLISFLGPDYSSSEQSAAADFLKAFITISANSNTDNSTIGPNELTRELVSEPVVEELVRLMLYGGSGLANSVGIIIEIIRKNNSDYDIVPVLYITIKSHPPLPTDPIYLGTLVKVFTRNIPNFTEMLERQTTQVLETPFGSIEPLGFERFKICELVAELLHCSNMALLNDDKGEQIVEERDRERIRLKQLAKKRQQDHDFDDEDNDNNEGGNVDDDDETRGMYGEEDISRDINNLDIEDEDDEERDDSFNNTANNTADMMMMNEGKDHEGDYSVEMEELDTTQTMAPQSNEDEEAMIRANPVVGDQLKIALADNNVIITILDMFFKFPWNNFLHNVVFDIVQQVLNGSMEVGYNKFLAIELFGKGNITKLIIEGQQKCEDYEEQTGLRLGYMGHLTLIAEEVVKFVSLYAPESISMVIHDAVADEEWNRYVNETLVETREKYNAILGGITGDEDDLGNDSQGLILDPNTDHDLSGVEYQDDDYDDDDDEEDDDERMRESHGQISEPGHELDDDEDDEEDDYHSMNRSTNLSKSQYEEHVEEDSNQFSRYMNQQMTSDLPDKFGSSDEDDEDDGPGSWTMSSDFTSKINNNNNNNHDYRQSKVPQLQHLEMSLKDDDEDEYVDPNDDGQSYAKKSHPLYTPTGDLLDQFNDKLLHDPEQRYEPPEFDEDSQAHNNSMELGDDEYRTDPLSDPESDDDEDDDESLSNSNNNSNNDDDIGDEGNGDEDEDEDDSTEDLGLMRTTSKGDLGWDDMEQRRLMTVASYIQSHSNGTNESSENHR